MSDYAAYKFKNIDGFEYIDSTKKIWIVYRQYETNKKEQVLAFDNEELARKCAGTIVGKNRCLIGIESIDVVRGVAI